MTDPRKGLSDEELDLIAQRNVQANAGMTRDLVRQKRSRWPIVVLAVCMAILAALSLLGYLTSHSSGEQIKQQNGTISSLQQQVRDLGGTPVAGPSGQTGARGATGPAPSDAQVRAAVRIVCTDTQTLCQQPVSIATLVSAVRSCEQSGQCPAPQTGATGKTGPSGAAGKSGAPGSAGPSGATGAQGPGPTSDQVVAGIAAYCGQTGCQGPPGKDGKDGKDGADGKDAPTVTAIDCTGPLLTDGLTFTYRFSNGTAITVTCTASGSTTSSSTPTDTPTDQPTS